MVAPARATKVDRRRNPSTSERLEDAVSFYEDLHWGEPATKVTRRRVAKTPKVASKLGELVAVTYETSKGGEHAEWEHHFGEEGGERPDLVVDPKNKRLHIVGGDYDVQAAGIID